MKTAPTKVKALMINIVSGNLMQLASADLAGVRYVCNHAFQPIILFWIAAKRGLNMPPLTSLSFDGFGFRPGI